MLCSVLYNRHVLHNADAISFVHVCTCAHFVPYKFKCNQATVTIRHYMLVVPHHSSAELALSCHDKMARFRKSSQRNMAASTNDNGSGVPPHLKLFAGVPVPVARRIPRLEAHCGPAVSGRKRHGRCLPRTRRIPLLEPHRLRKEGIVHQHR